MALFLALLAALAGCHADSTRSGAPDHGPAAPPARPADARPPVDASYDWHGLLAAPFGSVLKEVPLALHEVLLFRDQARGGTAADDGECYASDAPAPRFVGRTPDEYLLCFKQDHLARIQASVRLTAAEAPEVFAAACAVWQKNAARTSGAAVPGSAASTAAADAGAPHAEAQSAGAQGTSLCKGRDGAIRFNGRLGEEPGSAETPAETSPSQTPSTETTLSITVDSVPNP
jgi:hypothetical protein